MGTMTISGVLEARRRAGTDLKLYDGFCQDNSGHYRVVCHYIRSTFKRYVCVFMYKKLNLTKRDTM